MRGKPSEIRATLARLNEPWAVIIASVIGGICAIIAAIIAFQLGENQGQTQAQATATIQRATSAAVAAVEATRLVETTRLVEVTRVVESTRLVEATRIVEVTSLPYPTSTAYPTYTPNPTYPPNPTLTPYPTYTPFPTSAAIQDSAPSPTRDTSLDTPEKSVLAEGETWRQEGMELTLVSASFSTTQIKITWKLTNKNEEPRPVRFDYTNFVVTDNNGIIYPINSYLSRYNDTIAPGDSIDNFDNSYAPMVVEGLEQPDENITDFTITASNVSRILKAQWNIPNKAN